MPVEVKKTTGKAFGKTNKKSCRTVPGPTHNMSALSKGRFFHACSSETPLDSLPLTRFPLPPDQHPFVNESDGRNARQTSVISIV